MIYTTLRYLIVMGLLFNALPDVNGMDGNGGGILLEGVDENGVHVQWPITDNSLNAINIDGWCGVSYGDGQWVAVHQNGRVATSPDGITWTQSGQDSSIDYGVIGGSCDGVSYGNDQWLAVGWNGNVATSLDGVTWTLRCGSSDGCTGLVGASYGDGKWLALHDAGGVATSPDGSTWAPHGEPSDGAGSLNVMSYSGWRGISYGNDQWLALNRDGRVATSPDGITWTPSGSITGDGSLDARENWRSAWEGVSYGSGQWLALNRDGRVATSPDGITWTQSGPSSGDGSLDTIEKGTWGGWSGVSYDGGKWLAIHSNGKVATSPDGITWTLKSGRCIRLLGGSPNAPRLDSVLPSSDFALSPPDLPWLDFAPPADGNNAPSPVSAYPFPSSFAPPADGNNAPSPVSAVMPHADGNNAPLPVSASSANGNNATSPYPFPTSFPSLTNGNNAPSPYPFPSSFPPLTNGNNAPSPVSASSADGNKRNSFYK